MPTPTTTRVSRPQAQGYGVRIGENFYRLVSLPNARPMVETAPLQPPRIDTAANPEDFRPEAGVVYSLARFSGGEGQDFAHRPDSDPSRYWDSKGIDVAPPHPGTPDVFTLLHDVDLIEAATDATLRLTFCDGSVYMNEGTTVRRTDDPTAATPTFVNDDPHAGQAAVTVLDLTTLGDEVYAALGTSGIHKRSNAGTWTHWSDLAATRVWTAKERVIASTGAALHHAKATTTSDLLHTLEAGHEWTDVVEADQYILASATDGHVYAFTLNESTAALTIAARTPISPVESVTCLGFHPSGLVFLGTSEPNGSGKIGRFYRAGLTDNGTISFLTVIRQWGDCDCVEDRSPQAIAVFRDSVFTGVDEESLNSHVWRYDLETTGRVRELDAGGSGLITDIIPVYNRVYFARSGAGLYREDTTSYVASGYLITSLADHHTTTFKSWAGALLDVAEVNGGRVELYYSTNPEAILDPLHESWIRVRNITTETSEREHAFNAHSRFLAGMVKVYADATATATPSVRSVAFRAFSGPGDIILNLAVNISDRIELRGRLPIVAHGLGRRVYDTLKGIEGTAKYVELFDPSERVQGVVDSVSSPVEAIDVKGSLTLVSQVVIRGRRTGQEATTQSLGALGVGVLGVAIMGGEAL